MKTDRTYIYVYMCISLSLSLSIYIYIYTEDQDDHRGAQDEAPARRVRQDVITTTVDFRNFIVFFWAETLAH